MSIEAMKTLHPERSPDHSITAESGSHVSQVKIDLGGTTLLVVAILTLIIGACGVVMGLNLSKQGRQDEDFKALKTQEWLLERRLMDKEALAIAHGEMLPSDIEYGATGNLQRMKPQRGK